MLPEKYICYFSTCFISTDLRQLNNYYKFDRAKCPGHLELQVMNFIKETNYSHSFFLFVVLVLISPLPTNGNPDLAQEHPEIQSIIIGGDSVLYDATLSKYTRGGRDDYFSGFVTIPHKFNSVLFLIDALESDTGSFFQYYLDGFDDKWGKSVGFPVKEYSNLPQGKFTFFVRTSHSNGKYSEPASFSFQVLPSFYQTKLALFLYLIALIMLYTTFTKIRTYRFAQEKFRLERIINERTDELVKEKDKSEKLLANVLPKDTANELKTKGKATKKKYQMATVLFSDIQGFTKIAEQMNPEKLIDQLDSFFFHFDSVVEKYNTEKIKTIGDAYMCAGGIPEKNRTNPVEVVMASLEMQKYMAGLHEQARKNNSSFWDIRIGIHTGSVIAGVIGHKKLSYDIWGDTVNTASRMESSGEAGKINISGSTYQLVKDFYICEYRGKMPVKYKGEIDMYFVKGIRPELSNVDTGEPNEKFFVNLQLLRLNDLEDTILAKFDNEIRDDLKYHNRKHTVHVYTQVELLGRAEKVKDEDMLLLRTAGLLHDIGYLVDYMNHKKASCDFTRGFLPGFQYSEGQINKVCKLIMATQESGDQANLLERIICDANLDFLGRVDYPKVSLSLYKEMKALKKVGSFEEWRKDQTRLLQNHEFYTNTARLLRDVGKKDQLAQLKLLEESS